MSFSYLAGIELGGTTCVAAIAKSCDPTSIVHRTEVPTTTREVSLPALSRFLKEKLKELNIEKYQALGITSFGPVDLDQDSKTYGFITSTPKEKWRYVDVVQFFKSEFDDQTPIVFETDVNAPAMVEASNEIKKVGCKGAPTVVYITVGTGVGVGISINGNPVHGLLHPEGGHMLVPKMPGDAYLGCCKFEHYCCVEGLVNSQAISERAGVDQLHLHTIEDSNAVWDTVGYYLGALCLNITYLLSPHFIVLGGGIMKRALLYDKTRHWFRQLMKGYLDVDKFKTQEGLADYIRPSVYGNDAGIIGALELAKKAIQHQ